MSLTNCRFYEQKYPAVDDFVMVQVTKIGDMGAYVKLLEYDKIDGMLLLSELSRRRIRSIQKLIREGQIYVCVVIRVDEQKGYIDLSRRRVDAEDIPPCTERYQKSKVVHSIMRHVAETTQTPLEQLYQTIAWPLNKKYGHAHDAFKISTRSPEVWADIEFSSKAVEDELKAFIARRMVDKPIKCRADVEVTCFVEPGIEAIKEALRAAEANNTEDITVKARLVSSPLFVLTCHSLDKNEGIARLEQAIVDVRGNIEKAGGSLKVKMEPKAVTAADDAELQALMEKHEHDMEEVDGDDDDSEIEDAVI